MTEKEAVLAELDFIKTVTGNTIIGALIGLAIYHVQTPSSDVVAVSVTILILGIMFAYFRSYMLRLLDKLKSMPLE